jgi:glycosyltransferase involved in cell wall biosynthesis
MGIRPDKVHLIPSGANVRTIDVRDMKACRKELGIALESPLACFMGFVQYDIELVIKAFKVALSRVPDARLLLIGPVNPRVSALADELEISAFVREAGAVRFEEVPKYLGAADLLLMPVSDNLMNRARGPIKLGDYLAAGRAILANPVGDLADVFNNDEVGVMAGDSPLDYGAAMAELLSDRDRCASLGRRARKVAEEKYDWRFLAPQLEAVYDRARAGF